MSRRQYTYRGLTPEQLEKLPMDEFIALLPARQRRSLLRGLPPRHIRLLEKIRKIHAEERQHKTVVRTHCRDMIVIPEMIGTRLAVHNGREFLPATVTPEMVGHYLGEFAPTTKVVNHGMPGVGATRSSQYVPLK